MDTAKQSGIDLDFCPALYFWPHGLEKHLLAKVKGAQRKAALKRLIAEGRLGEVPDFLARSALTENERRAIGNLHPMFMGGEYLPDMGPEEIEIARISIQSTTCDVTSVYAHRGEGGIHYRAVDEYEGDTLDEPRECESRDPLTLGELCDFFLQAWPFMQVLEGNFEEDVQGMLGFFTSDSASYPQFDALLRKRVWAEHGQTRVGD